MVIIYVDKDNKERNNINKKSKNKRNNEIIRISNYFFYKFDLNISSNFLSD